MGISHEIPHRAKVEVVYGMYICMRSRGSCAEQRIRRVRVATTATTGLAPQKARSESGDESECFLARVCTDYPFILGVYIIRTRDRVSLLSLSANSNWTCGVHFCFPRSQCLPFISRFFARDFERKVNEDECPFDFCDKTHISVYLYFYVVRGK